VAEFSLTNSAPLGPSILARLPMTRQFGEPSETTILSSFSPRQSNTQRKVRNRKKPSQALTRCQVCRNQTLKFPTGAKAVPTGCGIVIDGNELFEDSKNIERKLIQVDIQDTFHEARGGLVFSYSIAMNPNRLISVLTKNVVFIRQVSETTYELSTISITKDDELIYFTFQMKENRRPST
jgi:hypothetical protein